MPDPVQYPMTVTSGSTRANRTGTWRAYRPVYVQYTPPCREACPAGEDVARWIDLLRGKAYQQAWEILTEDNPFPAVMGRICVHPCQTHCNRGQLDEAVGINALEQFLGDRALEEGWAFSSPVVERPERIAVVGGGPGGLSCAYHLRRLGYQVTLFEAGDRLGGQLATALPEFQLPVEIVAGEVRRILDLGVEVRCGVRVGHEMSWLEVRQGYRAVFLATGAPVVARPELPGEDLPGVLDGVELLRDAKSGKALVVRAAGLGTGEPVAPLRAGSRAVVVGAGLTGIEAARTLIRLGAEVTMVSAEPWERLPLRDRVAEAQDDGVEVLCEAVPQAILGRHHVIALGLADRELVADTVVLATGRMVDLESLPEEAEMDMKSSMASLRIVADPFTTETTLPGVFAGGDVVGTRYAVEAVGAGKRAAAAIHAHVQGQDLKQALAASRLGYSPNLSMRYYSRPESYPPQVHVKLQRVVTFDEIETLYFEPRPQVRRAWLPPAKRTHPFAETRQGLGEAAALAESQRCFNCGTCIGCDNCLIFCPDMAIAKTMDGAAFEVDWNYCKGCGACVRECPREALVLEEELK